MTTYNYKDYIKVFISALFMQQRSQINVNQELVVVKSIKRNNLHVFVCPSAKPDVKKITNPETHFLA